VFGKPWWVSGKTTLINKKHPWWVSGKFSSQATACKERNQIMADYKVNDAVVNIAQSVRDAGQAVTESTVAAYERNVGFAQSTLENGVEVLKSHAESARSLLREQAERAQDKQPLDAQAVLNTAIAAQERNMHYAQTTFENGVELWKNHVRGTRSLLDKLAEQGQHHQEAFRHIAHESVNAYVDLFFTPFSYYKQAIDTAESIAWQGVETAQKVGRQGFETAQHVSRQGFETARRGVETAQDITHRGFETAQNIGRQTAEAAQRAAYQGQQTPESNNQ